jgi:hypothetical protein
VIDDYALASLCVLLVLVFAALVAVVVGMWV